MIVNIRLPGWFTATGLCVTVKQPDSRGTPGFFVAIFSVVAQFEVCPVGWYNCRMEFLERVKIHPSPRCRSAWSGPIHNPKAHSDLGQLRANWPRETGLSDGQFTILNMDLIRNTILLCENWC